MKKIAYVLLLVTFFNFSNPEICKANPAAIIGVAAVGAVLITTATGTYYTQNGHMPWTNNNSEGSNTLVSIAAYNASGPMIITSIAGGIAQTQNSLIGKPGVISAKMGDIVNFAKQSAASTYAALQDLIADHTPPDAMPVLAPGDILKGASGKNYKMAPPGWFFYMRYPPGLFNNGGYPILLSDGSTAYFNEASQSMIRQMNDPDYEGRVSYYAANFELTNLIPTVAPVPGFVDVPGLNDDVAPPPAGQVTNPQLANEIKDIIAHLPRAQVIASTSAPTAAGVADAPPALTAAEVQQALTDNAVATATAASQQIAANAAANPADVAAQNAALQAAAEAAKAQAEAAQQDSAPDEPDYPSPPSSWYTATCDRSGGIENCINYQQVIDATHSFQGTFIYQMPHLMLNCLDYVKGSGCEHPPKLQINMQNSLINKPIDIDLTPFSSVVSVMKFFFSLLCLVLTGKAVMVLFG